jgi:protein gp37
LPTDSAWAYGDRRFFGDKHWNEPRRWNRKAADAGVRRRVFCASMADVFEERSDLDEHRERLWELIVETPELDWLLLTKRPQNVLEMVPDDWHMEGVEEWSGVWPANAWVGTTVEDNAHARVRLRRLVRVPAPILFVSAEPLLGLLPDLRQFLMPGRWSGGVNWVLVGGESGAHPRRMDPAWAQLLMDHCDEVGVPFHFKQLGAALAREMGVDPPGAHLTADDPVPAWMLRQDVPA